MLPALQRPTLVDRLTDDGLAIGCLVSQVRTPALARLLSEAGHHFFIIDCEHGSYTSETTADLCAAGVDAGISPVVRIAEITRESVLRPLDSGAEGILVPQVDSVEQAEQVVAYAKYPPMGVRGAVVRRAHSRYRKIPPNEFLKERNRNTLVAVQIESEMGLKHCEAIAQVRGVDVLFVGPLDLSVSLGYPGELGRTEVKEAMRRVFETARAAGKVAGIHLADASLGAEWIGYGGRFLSLGGDIEYIVEGARAAFDGATGAASV